MLSETNLHSTNSVRQNLSAADQASKKTLSLPAIPALTSQLKTLADTGAVNYLEDSNIKRTTVGDDKLSVKMFNKNVLDKVATSKVNALQIAAEQNAKVGADIDNWGRINKVGKGRKAWSPANMFTRAPENLEKKAVATLDPFFLFTTVRYDTDVNTHYLHMNFQHAADLQGYVEAIIDTGNDSTKEVPSMYKGSEDKRTGGVDRNPQYQQLHDKETVGKLIDLTAGGGEKNLDAYTKLAGEGARWQCVRNHAANIEDTSYFYTASGAGRNKVLAVEFRELWVSWKDDFKKKYNIPDTEVRRVMLAKGTTLEEKSGTVPIEKLGSGDYNLDTGKQHGA
jgi:hypothetical protein